MNIPKPVLERLMEQHPHSQEILSGFLPLFAAQDALAETLPAPELPRLDTASFALGKPWLPALDMADGLYLDQAFLAAAPRVIAEAAAGSFPQIAEDTVAIGSLLTEQPDAARELALFRLKGKPGKIRGWAKKHAVSAVAAELFATHLAGAAARRVDKAASSVILPTWGKNYCPVCGSHAHISCLRHKEGRRYLQCSLCRREWLFSRTTCPACGQDSPSELSLFFLEDRQFERAEACNVCKRYILAVDMRELTDDTPPEVYALCMMPLDLLMREKDFEPLSASA